MYTKSSCQNVLTCIEKLIYLEKNLGHCVSYKTLHPQTLHPYAHDLNQLAGKIAKFVGLDSIPTVIRTTISQNTAGNIQFDENFDFIEIDKDSTYENTLAILAHEIMHRYLYNHGLLWNDELLTDIATIYTGLGKLSLNGIYTVTTTPTLFGTKISTMKIGYLDNEDFCFIYLLISKLRGMSDADCTDGLNVQAYKMLAHVCKIKNSVWVELSRNLDNNFSCFSQYYNTTKEEEQQLNIHVSIIQSSDAYVKWLQNNIATLRHNYSLVQEKIHSLAHQQESNPVLKSLVNMEQSIKLKELLLTQQTELKKISKHSNKLNKFLQKQMNKKNMRSLFWIIPLFIVAASLLLCVVANQYQPDDIKVIIDGATYVLPEELGAEYEAFLERNEEKGKEMLRSGEYTIQDIFGEKSVKVKVKKFYKDMTPEEQASAETYIGGKNGTAEEKEKDLQNLKNNKKPLYKEYSVSGTEYAALPEDIREKVDEKLRTALRKKAKEKYADRIVSEAVEVY